MSLRVVWMDGVGGSSRFCLLPGMMGWRRILTKVEEIGVWPDGLLDA